MKLAIDAMGSDKGSAIVVEAVLDFLKKYPDVQLVVVGDPVELKPLQGHVELVETHEIMKMEDGALEVMRRKNTSMIKAVELASSRQCDAVVSAGSTGAFLTAATIKMKLIPGVERAALMSPFPTITGSEVIVLDIGANNENTPSHLVDFAKMGDVYARHYLKRQESRVYLLSNGAEEKKGSPVVKEAHQLLKPYAFFKGNMEARYLFDGEADVIVAPGFEGNIVLKNTEGVAGMFKALIKQAFKRNLAAKIGYLLARKGFDEMGERLNYKKYGGALLLGINGIAVKAHGSSDAFAFFNAMRLAKELVDAQIVARLGEAFADGTH